MLILKLRHSFTLLLTLYCQQPATQAAPLLSPYLPFLWDPYYRAVFDVIDEEEAENGACTQPG